MNTLLALMDKMQQKDELNGKSIVNIANSTVEYGALEASSTFGYDLIELSYITELAYPNLRNVYRILGASFVHGVKLGEIFLLGDSGIARVSGGDLQNLLDNHSNKTDYAKRIATLRNHLHKVEYLREPHEIEIQGSRVLKYMWREHKIRFKDVWDCYIVPRALCRESKDPDLYNYCNTTTGTRLSHFVQAAIFDDNNPWPLKHLEVERGKLYVPGIVFKEHSATGRGKIGISIGGTVKWLNTIPRDKEVKSVVSDEFYQFGRTAYQILKRRSELCHKNRKRIEEAVAHIYSKKG